MTRRKLTLSQFRLWDRVRDARARKRRAYTLTLRPTGGDDTQLLQLAAEVCRLNRGGTIRLLRGVFRTTAPAEFPRNTLLCGENDTGTPYVQ